MSGEDETPEPGFVPKILRTQIMRCQKRVPVFEPSLVRCVLCLDNTQVLLMLDREPCSTRTPTPTSQSNDPKAVSRPHLSLTPNARPTPEAELQRNASWNFFPMLSCLQKGRCWVMCPKLGQNKHRSFMHGIWASGGKIDNARSEQFTPNACM